ncbi:hypothetical protein VPNG_01214 [Cytospora leucostoma]|uniref:Amine oxidase domain-containing protein n=1 Tax=Cytospora leucostoma TaxID=1230097 RepID=A0A423XLD7_9PEZI|nr:hypothetical protein VPNG_01214 [Cytospora leucostoma]
MVDTGFMILNKRTYPNFVNFLNRIKVPTVPTDMSFGMSRDRGAFEWAEMSLDSIFCQRRRLFSPGMWRMIFDIIRFNHFALELLIEEDSESHKAAPANGNGNGVHRWLLSTSKQTIGEYLEKEGYSNAFRDDYLIPMIAAVWSMSPDKDILELPAATVVRFLLNHDLLSSFATRPAWLTIREGSRMYIDFVTKGFPPNHLFLRTPVKSIVNDRDGKVRLHLQGGESAVYDHVILATPGDAAYQVIKSTATVEEQAIMSKFHTCKTTAVLHSDISHMPASRRAWSGCSSLSLSSPSPGNSCIEHVSVTYNMNVLQHIPRQPFGDVLITLDPLHDPDPKAVQGRYEYKRPLYNAESICARDMLPSIQNRRGISFAGAWTKYGHGNHEDGFSSGLSVAREHLGARLPFDYVDPTTYSHGRAPALELSDHLARLIILIVQVFLILPLERIAEHLSMSGQKAVGLLKGHLRRERK